MKNLLTTQNQNCYREQIEKECYARLAWKNRYGQDYPTCFVSRRAKEPLPKLSQITAQNSTTKASTTKASTTKASTTKASITKASITKASITKASITKASLPPVLSTLEKREAAGPQDRSFREVPLMRPVTPQTQETLYQGFSKEGKGRSRYLHARTRKAPEEKFDYPLLSSWDYGWRLGDSGREYRSPANGRSGVVKNAFYARNGIFNCTSESDRLG